MGATEKADILLEENEKRENKELCDNNRAVESHNGVKLVRSKLGGMHCIPNKVNGGAGRGILGDCELVQCTLCILDRASQRLASGPHTLRRPMETNEKSYRK